MASINHMFATMLNDGITASKAISDPEKKALACAELAKALAMTGLVSVVDSESANAATPEEEKESLKEKAKPRQKATSKREKAPVPAAEEPKEEAAAEEADSEVEVTDEWTEEMVDQFSEQLARIEQLQEEYDEETLDDCVKNFSEGVLNGIEDISPLNIDGFIAYIQMLLSDAEAE
ncbi:hypothetical protein P8918_12670 [Bacillus spizizenii]|nr:hypothetical protein [Bacillus spizizenii]MCY8890422.1 hypothetical protein [Bacillus spizizenii]MEC0841877.1 hypothetical protein [Bacillus spizizenii]